MPEFSCPKDEVVWQSHSDGDGNPVYYITSKCASREYYFLYLWDGTKFVKKGKGRNPPDLIEKYVPDT